MPVPTPPAPPTDLEIQQIAQTAHSAEDLLTGNSNILDQLMLMVEKGLFQPIIYWQLLTIGGSFIVGGIGAWLVRLYIRKRFWHYLAKEKFICMLDNSGSSLEKKGTATFWAALIGATLELVISLSWPVISIVCVYVITHITRHMGLLPGHALPLESIYLLILVAYIIIRTLVYLINQTFAQGKSTSKLETTISLCIWVGVALQVTGVLPKAQDWLEITKVPIGASQISLWNALMAFITIAIAMFIAKWIAQLSEKWVQSVRGMHGNVKVVLIRFIKVVLFIGAVMIGLSAVGIDLTILGVFGGAVGVGLGFGLQKIASNYISGFIILLDRSIKIGDLVNVSGVEGLVTDIKTRYTVVKQYDGTVTIIPNESFVTSNVQNSSYLQGPNRGTLGLSVDYSTDVEQAIDIVNQVLLKEPRILINPSPYTLLTNFGDDGIELTAYFWIADVEAGTTTLKSSISRKVLKRFREENISIPFPQRDLRILAMPEISCKFETGKAPEEPQDTPPEPTPELQNRQAAD
ncbi:MAG: mechanosensitive ion channel [Burkholderiales bacterium]|nr:mechanosensitive ion channel [Burkholderiales bacterium]